MPEFTMSKTSESLVFKVTGYEKPEKFETLTALSYDQQLRVLVEGDSWANILWPLSALVGYNQAFPNILEADSRFYVRNVGYPGDTFENIVSAVEDKKGLYPSIQSGSFEFLILSGGGNDFLGGGALKNFLKPYRQGVSSVADCLDADKIDAIFKKISDRYEYLIKCVHKWSKKTHIFLHGYDHALPRVGGRWLGDPFAALGYNPQSSLCADIIRILVDRFYDLLESVAQSYSFVHVVNVRGTCAGHWHDELHPDLVAATNIANKFIDKMLGTRTSATTFLALSPAGARGDGDCVDALVNLGSSSESIKIIHQKAAQYMQGTGSTFPHNACAATLSAFLQAANIPVKTTVGAGRLAKRLEEERNWARVEVGRQRAGDVGVTQDNTSPAGADHIYLVVKAVDSDLMIIADNQSPRPHERYASGRGKTKTDYFLRAQGGVWISSLSTENDTVDYSNYPFEDEDTNGLIEPETGDLQPLLLKTHLLPMEKDVFSEDLLEKIANRIAELVKEKLEK